MQRINSSPSPAAPTRRSVLRTAGAALLAAGAAGLVRPARLLAREDNPDRKLGFALVGIGNLTMNQLLPGFANTKHCAPVALVSGHPDKAKAQAEKYGINPKFIYNYENFDTIADNPAIDVVYVVLPNSMHAEYTIRAAKAGKHVLCEKPMATSVADCQKMIDACKAAGKKLSIGYRLRYEPNTLALIDLVKEKKLGDLAMVTAEAGFNIGDPNQWRLKKALSGGGCLQDIGIYALQAARYISGEEPIEVNAMTYAVPGDPRFREVESDCNFQLRFRHGVLADCISTYRYGCNRFRAYGPQGWAEVDPALSYHGVDFRFKTGKEVEDPNLPDIDQFAAEMDAFAECILQDKPSRTPGEMGLQDIKIMDAIYEAAKTGRAVAIK